jgi:type I restriction enzyme, S subunit
MSQRPTPSGWRTLLIGDIATVRGGNAFPENYQGAKEGEYPFYKVSDMNLLGNETRMTLANNYISKEVLTTLKAKPFPPLTVIFPKVGAAVHTNKKRILSCDALIDNNVMGISIEAQEECDAVYLYYWFESINISDFSNPGALPSITGQRIKDVPVPIPPLPEQHAIARAVRAVQEAKEARQRELGLERERKAGLMRYLFSHGMGGAQSATKRTRFGIVPQCWVIRPLSECAFVQTGVAKGRRLNAEETIELPYLRVANVQDGYLDLSEIKTIKIRESEVNRYSLQVGDVLMTEGGDFDKLGRGFIWFGQVEHCIHQNHIFAVRTNHDVLLPEYFAYLIQSDYGKEYFLSVAHRTTNLASINSTKLKALPVLLPQRDEQQLIVNTLKSCDGKIDALDKESALLEELFKVMLEELLSGRLSAISLIET